MQMDIDFGENRMGALVTTTQVDTYCFNAIAEDRLELFL